jgi:hypothetical protein
VTNKTDFPPLFGADGRLAHVMPSLPDGAIGGVHLLEYFSCSPGMLARLNKTDRKQNP